MHHGSHPKKKAPVMTIIETDLQKQKSATATIHCNLYSCHNPRGDEISWMEVKWLSREFRDRESRFLEVGHGTEYLIVYFPNIVFKKPLSEPNPELQKSNCVYAKARKRQGQKSNKKKPTIPTHCKTRIL